MSPDSPPLDSSKHRLSLGISYLAGLKAKTGFLLPWFNFEPGGREAVGQACHWALTRLMLNQVSLCFAFEARGAMFSNLFVARHFSAQRQII